jgi:hypothetical protein
VPASHGVKLALPRAIDPGLAQIWLTAAQDALFKLMTGQLPSAVETPQLGRTQFAATNVADLQRLIDYLNGIVTSAGSTNGNGSSGANVRKPFSFYGWP